MGDRIGNVNVSDIVLELVCVVDSVLDVEAVSVFEVDPVGDVVSDKELERDLEKELERELLLLMLTDNESDAEDVSV
jgi:hypothetical protein